MKRVAGMLFLVVAALPCATITSYRHDMMLWGRKPDSARVEAPTKTLVIVSAHRREIRQEYSRGFGRWMKERYGQNVEIRWLDVGGASKMLKDLESRFSIHPDKPGVDILFGGGVEPYLTSVGKGWLERVDLTPGVLEGIPPLCAGMPVYDPEHKWFGVALSGFGILYNRRLVERLHLPVPRNWEDLGRPEFFTWISSGDPRSSGSVHACFEIILQAYGYEKGWGVLTKICANVRRFSESGSAAPREIAAGDVAAGMVIDQYAQTVLRSVGPEALVFVLPEGATVINADAIGVLKGAAEPELARQFVEYVLSQEGQRLLYQPAGTAGQQHSLYRLPVRKASYDEPVAPPTRPYEYGGSFHYDTEKASKRRDVLNDLIGIWLIDAHPELARAWKGVIERGMKETEIRALFVPPVTEAELETLGLKWGDQRLRLETTKQWARAALERYRGLRDN